MFLLKKQLFAFPVLLFLAVLLPFVFQPLLFLFLLPPFVFRSLLLKQQIAHSFFATGCMRMPRTWPNPLVKFTYHPTSTQLVHVSSSISSCGLAAGGFLVDFLCFDFLLCFLGIFVCKSGSFALLLLAIFQLLPVLCNNNSLCSRNGMWKFCFFLLEDGGYISSEMN